jgi:hypothetical protein
MVGGAKVAPQNGSATPALRSPLRTRLRSQICIRSALAPQTPRVSRENPCGAACGAPLRKPLTHLLLRSLRSHSRQPWPRIPQTCSTDVSPDTSIDKIARSCQSTLVSPRSDRAAGLGQTMSLSTRLALAAVGILLLGIVILGARNFIPAFRSTPAGAPPPVPLAHFVVVSTDWQYLPGGGQYRAYAHGIFRNDGTAVGNAQVVLSEAGQAHECSALLPVVPVGSVAETTCFVSDAFSDPYFSNFIFTGKSPAPPIPRVINP